MNHYSDQKVIQFHKSRIELPSSQIEEANQYDDESELTPIKTYSKLKKIDALWKIKFK